MLARRLCFYGALLLTGTTAATAAAQAPDNADKDTQQSAAIHSTTRLVQLSVVVKDRKGDPLTGLTKENFSILDRGHPQTIAIFSEAIPAPSETPRPLPFNVFTNRFDQEGQDPGAVTIILFDALNTSSEDQPANSCSSTTPMWMPKSARTGTSGAWEPTPPISWKRPGH